MLTGRVLLYTTFLLLLISTFLLSLAGQGIAADYSGLPASAEEIEPLRAGDRAPTFTVRTVQNHPFTFDPRNLQRPTIFISFRGGWCPYCNMHLSELRTVIPEIRELGFDVFFLSGDRPEALHDGLEKETQDDIAGLDYVILSDADIHAAMAFGTAFRVAEDYIAKLDSRGYDIADSSIRRYGALPVPAVYVINRAGEIVYDYVNADYKVRLPAEELLEVARGLSSED